MWSKEMPHSGECHLTQFEVKEGLILFWALFYLVLPVSLGVLILSHMICHFSLLTHIVEPKGSDYSFT